MSNEQRVDRLWREAMLEADRCDDAGADWREPDPAIVSLVQELQRRVALGDIDAVALAYVDRAGSVGTAYEAGRSSTLLHGATVKLLPLVAAVGGVLGARLCLGVMTLIRRIGEWITWQDGRRPTDDA